MDTKSSQFDINFVVKNFEPETVVLKSNEKLFSEGQPNDFVYYVQEGSIKVTKKNWAIGITYPEEFVGITSCINEGSIYTFSATSNEPSTVLKINKSKFREILLDKPAFSKFIIEILCDRIRRIDLKTSSFLELPPERRVIVELLNNFKEIGKELISNLSISDLAELTGVSARVVKKLISKYTEQQILAIKGSNQLILLNKSKLEGLLD